MARVKGGKSKLKRRKHLLKYTKGFLYGRKSKIREAKTALMHAWRYAYRDRRVRKREFRRLWQLKINAATREAGMPYNQFIHALKLKKIELDRKILAEFAANQPEIFAKILEEVKK